MRFNLSIALIFLLGGFVIAQTPIKTIDAVLNKLHLEDDFNGNVLITEKGKTVYKKSFGYANHENKIPLSENTIFPIGSIAKTFTAIAILKLKEQGKLDLDDRLIKFLPDLPYKNVTLRHLLTHTSGLPEYQSEAVIKEIQGKGAGNADLEKAFVKLNLKQDFEPGGRWEYSNTNFIFLALIIEKASGKNYAQFLRENVFQPARMQNSFVLKSGVPERLRKNVADGYRSTSFVSADGVNVKDLRGANAYYATVSNLYGAGGIYSTAGDLNRFHNALQNNKILKKQTLAEMYRPVKIKGASYAALRNTNYESEYGLGWFVAKDNAKGQIVYHPGGTVGFVSYFLRNIDTNQSIIILTNNEFLKHYTPTALMRILNDQTYKLDSKSLAKALGKEYNLRGIESAVKLFDNLKNNTEYSFREAELNDLGYQLMLDKQDAKAAIEILKINAEKFPESFNVWDSLGEIYYRAGNREEAVKNYEKSLRLNPKNEDGKQMLEKIKKELEKP